MTPFHLGDKDSLTQTSEIFFRLTFQSLHRRFTQNHTCKMMNINENIDSEKVPPENRNITFFLPANGTRMVAQMK